MQPELLFEGKYEILEKIREGGMGTIYKVRHRLLDEIRVVKVMRPHVVADADLKRRFLEEAKTAIRLKHPNLCTIHDFAADERGTAYLVMEYIDGANLADLLRSRGPFHASLSIEIGHQALLALGYLHRKGVIHRDIAPDNLMLTHDDEKRPAVKLIDLGIAKALNRVDATATGVFLGKLKYASPEQFGSLPPGEKIDGRSDLYGLGVVLYEILTGIRPYKAELPAELLRAHLVENPIPFSESDREGRVPPALRTIILRALEKKREQRYSTADEFDRDLVRLQGKFDTPADLETTAALMSRLRETKPSALDGVTPSAQDRLDRQFGAHSTPSPSAPPLTIVPAGEPTQPLVSDMAETIAAPPPPPASAPAPARASQRPEPSRRPVPPIDRTIEFRSPPPREEPPVATGRHGPGRKAGLVVVAAIAVVGLILWRPWAARRGEVKQANASAPTPVAQIAEQPTAPPLPTPAPTSAPNPEPTAVPSAVPTRGLDATERVAIENARTDAESARRRADSAQARDLAPTTYRKAMAKQAEASRLAAAGGDGIALRAFDAAASLYSEATTAALAAKALRAATVTPVRVAELPSAVPTVPRAPAPVVVPPTAAAPVEIAPPPTTADRRSSATRQDAPGAAEARDQITKVVGDYAWAQTTQDEKLFDQVFPGGIENFKLTFKNLKTQNVRLDIRSIDLQGNRATVVAHEIVVAKPRAGEEIRNDANVTLQLEKNADRWIIVSRR